MSNIILFGGTTEGRQLCEYFVGKNIQTTVFVATEYGETLLPKYSNIEVHTGRLDLLDMESAFKAKKPQIVIDATHPYAVKVTENIQEACKNTNTNYIRLIRESIKEENAVWTESFQGAVEYLNDHGGNVLLTIGSKELESFTKVDDYKNRLFARILPDYHMVKSCMELGFTGRHLICMQGPFSEELNYVLLKEYNVKYLVTKESGDYGGFVEKMRAAKRADSEVIIIRRPSEEKGCSITEVIKRIEETISSNF